MMEQNLFIRRAAVTDAELLAETRRSAWDATYRGIYPDAWIDEYDLAEQTQRERARLEQTDYMAYLVMDGGQCAGYFSYGAASHGGYDWQPRPGGGYQIDLVAHTYRRIGIQA